MANGSNRPGPGVYESDTSLSEYLIFHYGTRQQCLPYDFGPSDALRFPQRCAKRAINLLKRSPNRALDIGCAVGGSTFELAHEFSHVIGIDASSNFIRAANLLKEIGELQFSYRHEGNRSLSSTITIDRQDLRDRVFFQIGDACKIDPSLGQFDLVLLCNVLCRLYDPSSCLTRLSEIIPPGGVLFITTPCTWMEEYTPESNWLGGREGLDTLDSITNILEPNFTRLIVEEMPFLIREHARKFQWSVSQASGWIRK